MTKRIEPGLFARLMKLNSGTRHDILEFIGQTPIAGKDAVVLNSSRAANEDVAPEAQEQGT